MEDSIIVLDRCRSGDDSTSVRIRGQTSRRTAHQHGIVHGAVQVAVVISGYNDQSNIKPRILLHKRSMAKEISPGKWDICGGHIEAGPKLIQDCSEWEQQSYVEQLFFETALREVNEECRIQNICSSNPFRFEQRHLKRYGIVGKFESGFDEADSHNREYSTFYCAFVPQNVFSFSSEETTKKSLRVTDTTNADELEPEDASLPLRLLDLPALLEHFAQCENCYADGIARILKHFAARPRRQGAFTKFLETWAQYINDYTQVGLD
jgi:8-oxo-dGTP pyrophosphatase MutT (NUDIX family)